MPGAIGMILIMVLVSSAALGVFYSYVNYVGIIKQNADNSAAKAAENVVLSVQGRTLYASNVGGREVQVQDLIIDSAGSVSEQPYSSTLMPGSQTVISSSAINGLLTPAFFSNGAIGILTTFGNVFWYGTPSIIGTGPSVSSTSSCPISTVSVIQPGGGVVSWVGSGVSGSTSSFENITPTNKCPTVTMSESPQPGYSFNEWYVNGATDASNTISVNLGVANSVIAIFTSSTTSSSSTNSLTVLFADASGSPLQGLTSPLTVSLTGNNYNNETQVSTNGLLDNYYFAQFNGLTAGTYTMNLPGQFPYNMGFQGVDESTGALSQITVPSTSNLVGSLGPSEQVAVDGDTVVLVNYQVQPLSMNAYLNFGSNADPFVFNYGSPATAVVTAAFSDNQYTNSPYAGYALKAVFTLSSNQPIVASGKGTDYINYTVLGYPPAQKDASSGISCGVCQGTGMVSQTPGTGGNWNAQFSYIFIQGLGNDIVGGSPQVVCSYTNNAFNCNPYAAESIGSITEYAVAPATEAVQNNPPGSSSFYLVGQVLSSSGTPVSNAQVTLTSSGSGGSGSISMTTNSNGYYEKFISVTGPTTLSVSVSGASVSASIAWNRNTLSKINVMVDNPPPSTNPISMALAGITMSLTPGQSNYFDMMTAGSSYGYPYLFSIYSVSTTSTNNGGTSSSSTTYCVPGSPGVWTVPPGPIQNETVSYTTTGC